MARQLKADGASVVRERMFRSGVAVQTSVCEIDGGLSRGDRRYYANLFAASETLLAACEALCKQFEDAITFDDGCDREGWVTTEDREAVTAGLAAIDAATCRRDV